jgi:hypothetical protein
MKLSRVMLVVFAIGISNSVYADTNAVRPSCATWVKDRAEPNQPTGPAIADEKWLIGYLSGAASYSGIDVLKHADTESIYSWMDKYCKENPTNNIGQGGSKLFLELTYKTH